MTSTSVVVATRDRPDHLRDALTAIAAAVRPGDEVIVVDSASTDPDVRTIAERAGVTYLRCDRPGASLARNRGAEVAGGDLVVFTDDDCRPLPGWTDAYARAFDSDPRLDFATGAVVGPQISTEDVDAGPWLGAQDPAHFGHGANWACRRTAYDAVGGFDEAMGPGAPMRAAEDHDLFWRLLVAGCRGRHVDDAVVEHPAWRSFRDMVATEWAYGIGTGALTIKVRLSGTAGPTVRVRAWDQGLVKAAEAGRRNWKRPAIRHAVRSLGVVAGAAAARRRPVDGRLHFLA